MKNQDKPKFLEIMNGCASAYRQVLEKPGLAIYWNLLEPYEIGAVEKAFLTHIRTKTFFPNPAEIISLLDFKKKRVGADEAWAICDKDESRTIIWTEEMRQAYGIAYDLMADGDRIGARMAFKAAYERLCNESVMLDRPVKWSVSLGSDKQEAAQALKQAVELGRIAQDLHDALLPGPTDGGLIAKMITGTVTELPNNKQNFKKRWAEISLALAEGKARLDEKDRQRREDENKKQLAFEAKKQQAAEIAGLTKKH
jgi:hypothetical protein